VARVKRGDAGARRQVGQRRCRRCRGIAAARTCSSWETSAAIVSPPTACSTSRSIEEPRFGTPEEPAADLESGRWDEKHGPLREQASYEGSLRLVISEPA
jgi:hypothetical protein